MERHKAIFDYVLELQPDEREVFLRKISTEDPEVHREVLRLLDKSQADTQDVPSQPVPATSASKSYIFATGELIGERYRVIRAIARGGMGEVYEVADRELHSRVALKVINLKSAARPSAGEMFRREITLARQVTHPNVCRIYDLGHHDHPQHGDLLFLTMELLHGTTLSDYVRNSGTLTKEEALPLLEQMIHALAAAHKLNIAHRDFKSGNVILCGLTGSPEAAAAASTGSSGGSVRPSSGSPASPASGAAAKTPESSTSGPTVTQTSTPAASHDELKSAVVKVTDFGLARSLDGMETTVHNEIWGTPDYMAPEQFRGQSSIASDIYALGVVIYEMFTGKLPHRSSTSPVPPDGKPGSAMQNIPAEWRPIVRKCMAYEPGDRYATVDDVWSALRGERVGGEKTALLGGRALAAIAAVMIAVIGLTGWLERERIYRLFHPLPGPKHIAVLPFESIGGDADAKAFADGMGETLTSKLTQLEPFQKAFWIVPYSDSRKYHEVDAAYRNLNVTMVITGSVQRSNGQLSLIANLIDAKDHKQLNSRVLTASVGEIDTLQDHVWQSVAEMMDMQVSPEARHDLAQGQTKAPGAYEYYLQGTGYLLRRKSGTNAAIDIAIGQFQRSLELDPGYAPAHARLAEAYWRKYDDTHDPQWIKQAQEQSSKALELGPNSAISHVTAAILEQSTGNYEEAIKQANRAVALEPGNDQAYSVLASALAKKGQTSEAEATLKKALDLRPDYWNNHMRLGAFYFHQSRYSDAAAYYRNVVSLVPDNPDGYTDLGVMYHLQGREADAEQWLKKSITIRKTPEAVSNLATVYFFEGQYAEAVPLMEELVASGSKDYRVWGNMGDAYRWTPGKSEKAPQAYRKAIELAQQALDVNPHDSEALSNLALYQAKLGDTKSALRTSQRAVATAPGSGQVGFYAAIVYELAKDRSSALKQLSKSIGDGYSLTEIKAEPELRELRKDPRFVALLSEPRPN